MISNSGTLNVDQGFINCVARTPDHSDGLQTFSEGGSGNVNITNTCFRSYTDAEALSIYGAGFIGSDSIDWSDLFQGTISLQNVLIWGGSRGVKIDADVGTTHVSFDHVYFVPSPDGWTFFKTQIIPTGGTLIIDKWNEVRDATIVNGVIVPNALIPSP